MGEGRKVAKKSCSVGLRVYSMGWAPGKALACGRDALRGREPGGRRKPSPRPRLGGWNCCPPARSSRNAPAPLARGGRGRRGGGARGAGAPAAAGRSARESECEAAGGGLAGECAREEGREGSGARAPPGPRPSQPPGLRAASRPRAPAACRRRRSCSRRRCTGACPPPPALCFPPKMGATFPSSGAI